MPWACPSDACTFVIPLDSLLRCPACGTQKDVWSVVAGADASADRTLVVARPKRMDVRRGEDFEAIAGSSFPLTAISWKRTEEATVLPKEEVISLVDQGLLPSSHDRLIVWAYPGKRKEWTLTIAIEFEKKPIEERVFVFEVRPELLGDRGQFEVEFLCVFGEGAPPAELTGDVHVLDVGEDTPAGHAPQLVVTGFKSKPIPVTLRTNVPEEVIAFRGESIDPVASVEEYENATLRETSVVRAVPMSHVRSLLSRNLLPSPDDVVTLRTDPGKVNQPELTLEVVFEGEPPEEHAPRTFPAPNHEARFLFVYDEEEGLNMEIPGLHVVDVTDEAREEGFGVGLEASCLGGPVLDLDLDGTRAYELELVNRLGLPIPDAEVVLRFADGSERSEQVDAEGKLRLDDAPPGEIEITYPDPDDLVAKAEAGRAFKALEAKDPQQLSTALRHPPPLGPRIEEAYAAHFNTLSGQGLVEDVYAAFSDPDVVLHLELQMHQAGLSTKGMGLTGLESAKHTEPDEDEDIYGDLDEDESFEGEEDEEDIYAEIDEEFDL